MNLIVFWVSSFICFQLAFSQVDLCVRRNDPCQPGGKYDPLLERCTGYGGESCFACRTGEFCDEVDKTCAIKMSGGDPMLFEDFWEGIEGEPCSSISSDYRMNYQSGSNEILFAPLEQKIRELHILIGNSEVNGYEIVPGYGAFMVLDAALYGLTETGDQDHYEVFAQSPYYARYPIIVENGITSRKNRNGMPVSRTWNINANPDSLSTIEIVTHPNNPDGTFKVPKVKDPKRVIHDLVYYWPAFTEEISLKSNEIMVYSNTKHSGHAGSRFGWAIVKDKKVAQAMRDYLIIRTNSGLSIDTQIRQLSILTWLVNSFKTLKAKQLPSFYSFGREEMNWRWNTINSIFSSGNHTYELINSVSKGGFAWIKCPSGNNKTCEQLFLEVGIKGADGTGYGGTSQYLRVNMMGKRIEMEFTFDALRKRLSYF